MGGLGWGNRWRAGAITIARADGCGGRRRRGGVDRRLSSIGRRYHPLPRGWLRSRHVLVSRDLPAAPIQVVGDRDRLVQVLVNLPSDAAKASPFSGGRIWAEASASGGARVCFELPSSAADQPDPMP